jgi:hypothetical protein
MSSAWNECQDTMQMIDNLQPHIDGLRVSCWEMWLITRAYTNAARTAIAGGELPQLDALEGAVCRGPNAYTAPAWRLSLRQVCREMTAVYFVCRMQDKPPPKTLLPQIIRDVIGDPFRGRPPVRREWLIANDAAAVNVAKKAAQEGWDQPFIPADSINVLSDALEEAGCPENAEILSHLRDDNPHVYGCWAVDSIVNEGGCAL